MIGLILFSLILIEEVDSFSKVYELGGITVTAKRVELIPNLLIELTSEDLKSKGASTVGEALRFIPSIYSRTGRKGENYIEILGIEQREIVIMLDGHPIYSPYTGTADLEQIPLDNISKIEIALPPVSLLHGANSLGGIVNIVTKKYTKSVLLGVSSGASIKSIANYGNEIGDFYYYISGGISESDGYLLSDGTKRENSDYYKRRINGKIGWEPNTTTEFGISFANYSSEKGIPPGLTNPRFWRFTDWKWRYFALHGKTELFHKIKIRGSTFYDTHINTLVSYEDSTYNDTEWISDYDNNSAGAHITASINLGGFTTSTIGGSFKIDYVNKREDEELWEKYEGQTVAISIQEKIVIPSYRLHLEGEIGYDGFTGTDSHLHVINYRTGGVCFLGSENSLFFSIGKKNRFPTLKELYSPNSGNSDLLPEHSMSYQFGINLKQLKLVLFRNDVNDLIDRENRYANWENISWARFQGLSINGRYKFLTIGYTFLDAYDEFHKTLDNRAKNSANFGINYTFNFGLGINLNVFWIDRREDGDNYLDSYTLLNANISQRIGKFIKINLNSSNLKNEWHEDEIGYPLAGRILGVELLVNF